MGQNKWSGTQRTKSAPKISELGHGPYKGE